MNNASFLVNIDIIKNIEVGMKYLGFLSTANTMNRNVMMLKAHTGMSMPPPPQIVRTMWKLANRMQPKKE